MNAKSDRKANQDFLCQSWTVKQDPVAKTFLIKASSDHQQKRQTSQINSERIKLIILFPNTRAGDYVTQAKAHRKKRISLEFHFLCWRIFLGATLFPRTRKVIKRSAHFALRETAKRQPRSPKEKFPSDEISRRSPRKHKLEKAKKKTSWDSDYVILTWKHTFGVVGPAGRIPSLLAI